MAAPSRYAHPAWQPVDGVPSGLYHYELTRDGDELPYPGHPPASAAISAAISAAVARAGDADVLILVHGWGTRARDGRVTFNRRLARALAAERRSTRPVVYVGVHWPSHPVPELRAAGGGAGLGPAWWRAVEDHIERAVAGDGASALGKGEEADGLVRRMGEDEARAFVGALKAGAYQAAELSERAWGARGGRGGSAVRVRRRDLVGLAARCAPHIGELLRHGAREGRVTLPRVVYSFRGAVDEHAAAEPGRAGVRRLAALALDGLTFLAFFQFERRAAAAGEAGVKELLARVMRAGGRVHLVGHSLGCRVVSAAAVGRLPGKVHTLVLLQGAVRSEEYGKGGAYDGLATRRPVAGVVVATTAERDVALGTMERFCKGTIGTLGLLHLDAPVTVRHVSRDRDVDVGFKRGRFYTLRCDQVMRKLRRGVLDGKGVHSDVRDPALMCRIWEAVDVEVPARDLALS